MLIKMILRYMGKGWGAACGEESWRDKKVFQNPDSAQVLAYQEISIQLVIVLAKV